MGSGVVFVDSPFCPDGLHRCVEFLLLEERLVLVELYFLVYSL